MATAEQIKALMRSHYGTDNQRFSTLALQVAAYEAKQGHITLAEEIRGIVDKSKRKKFKYISFTPELDDLVFISNPKLHLSELIVAEKLQNRIKRILKEFHKQDKIKKFGLQHRRKLLLGGPPGTGKTMTAQILASELKLPLYTILMDKLVTKFMGETSAKLRQIFDVMIKEQRGVFLFDEFDAIGAERGLSNDVGEMRRVLNTFLQLIEQDNSDNLIIAATNNINLLDRALFRRFNDILTYQLPKGKEVEALISNRLGVFKDNFSLVGIKKETKTLSHAEITQACDDAIKDSILSQEEKVTKKLLLEMLKEKLSAY